MLESIKGFHIEPTNICTLKCPRCSRTQFIDKFGIHRWENHQINLVDFTNFFDIDISGKEFLLCGNYGDPIYYSDLFPMVSWLKEKNAIVNIVTNGSYRNLAWWTGLSSILTEADSVTFSVDGIPSNYTEYRVNADWASTEVGIRTMSQSNAKTIWKYIPFSFNETDIDTAKNISSDLGVDAFELSYSDRWDGIDDKFRPKQFTGPKEESKIVWHTNKDLSINPLCKSNNREHFIAANGYYTPCCFSANHNFYYASEFYKNRTRYDISNTTISQVLQNTTEFYSNIEQQKPKYCTFNCPST